MNRTTHRRPTKQLGRRLTALTAATALLLGCSSDDTESSVVISAETTTESISIELARSPIPETGQTTTPVYGILVNNSTSVVRVASASSPVAATVDLLGPDDSVQLPTDGFLVEPDGGLVMEPVGYKLMLIGIDPEEIGEEIPITLRFESGETFGFTADVRELDE